MKSNGLTRRLGALLLCALLCTCLACTASAENTGTITISYPVEGTVYHLYKVGSMQNDKIVLDAPFDKVNTSDPVTTASTLADMIQKAGVGTELASAAITDGKAVFSGLPMAIYLILGDPGEQDGIQYWPTPSLLSLPQAGTENDFLWDVNITGKMETSMDISVVKRWVGDSVIYRPTSITVRLKRDGETYGNPVVLNYVNNWSYMWEDLPPDNWYVTEDENPRYTTTITREGNTFIITNTWKQIPQTGQLWWPVSVLTILGLSFICLGLIRRRKSEKNG